jgi:hypothetical protein
MVFAKTSDAGVTVIKVDAAPVPVRATDCGEAVALLATLSDACSVPIVTGLKVTEIVQLAPPARVVAHVVV